MQNVWLWAAGAVLLATALTADAHRDGCHRWHSCPSDHNTYECGDLGHRRQYPDNAYCEEQQPRSKAEKRVSA
jgi:hypothetical protein